MTVHTEKMQTQVDGMYNCIDHIAIAVIDLETAIGYFCDTLGFKLIQRRSTAGQKTGMISAEIEHNNIKFVLCQGTEPQSQVSRLIEHFGPGVAHIAFNVNNVGAVADTLKNDGLEFDTTVIRGAGLSQIFSRRDPNSGLSFEFIERGGEQNFLDENVNELFTQLERTNAF